MDNCHMVCAVQLRKGIVRRNATKHTWAVLGGFIVPTTEFTTDLLPTHPNRRIKDSTIIRCISTFDHTTIVILTFQDYNEAAG